VEITFGRFDSVARRRASPAGGLDPSVPAALVLVTAGWLAGRAGVSPIEEDVFRQLNRDAGVAERPIWAAMQFGNGLMSVVAPVALRLAGASWSEATRVGVAAFGGWHLAKAVKLVVDRPRPATILDGVRLRDGDPDGRGFVSGHATVAAAVAVAAGPLVGRAGRRALLGLAAAVGVARVHVGAHLPLDVVGAVSLGVLWGSACAPRPRSTGAEATA
jgi:undecaprenyl-diphosphatase